MLEKMPTVPTGKNSDDVPCNSKKPKARPPNTLREKIIRNPLPYYSGPYSVGMIDIEVPVRESRNFSEIKRDHQYLLQLDTVLMSVWYPSGRFVFIQLSLKGGS
jgi:platelet-activating factor acetylhydrolase